MTRRELLLKSAATCLAGPAVMRAAIAPSAPVAVAKCQTYDSQEVLSTLDKMFDQLGGLGRIVKGKTVAIKINMTGGANQRLGYLPLGETHYTNPQVVIATVHLMGRAGAQRIRILESPSGADPLEEKLLLAGWEPLDIQNAAPRVEFENTNYLGRSRKYSRFNVSSGGYLYPGWDLNHSYEDCDVFVSLAKLKEHQTTGITLSMKNCFGITPCTIYGAGSGIDEPSLEPEGGRRTIHRGDRQPSKSAPSERFPSSPRDDGYRVPRAVVDLVAARPIDLAIVDGIKTMTGGEGPWCPWKIYGVNPGVLVAGTNPVNTDAVCMTVMGHDPMADRGTPPFQSSDNMLRLAEDIGLGTRDPKRIEVVGTPVKDALFDFKAYRKT